jgi:hypothetical protein
MCRLGREMVRPLFLIEGYRLRLLFRYYLVHEFIIYPKKSHKSPRAKTAESITPGSTTPAAPISPPGSDSGSTTPPEGQLPGTDTQSPSKRADSPASDLAAQALAALRSPKARSDGGLVAGIAVHELCMKIGRITVPPVCPSFHCCLKRC